MLLKKLCIKRKCFKTIPWPGKYRMLIDLTYVYAYTHTHARTHTHTLTLTLTNIFIYMISNASIHIHAHRHTYTHTNTYERSHSSTHTKNITCLSYITILLSTFQCICCVSQLYDVLIVSAFPFLIVLLFLTSSNPLPSFLLFFFSFLYYVQ